MMHDRLRLLLMYFDEREHNMTLIVVNVCVAVPLLLNGTGLYLSQSVSARGLLGGEHLAIVMLLLLADRKHSLLYESIALVSAAGLYVYHMLRALYIEDYIGAALWTALALVVGIKMVAIERL